MKKILGLLTVLLLAGMLMGCIGVKELTEEEEARVSEYAATLLLKYDANYNNLLWETEEEKKEEEEAEEPPAKEEEEKPEETVSGPAVTGGNPAVGPVIENKPLAEVFGLQGIDIQYVGCEFVKSFPEEGKHGYMIQAEEGRKLLIVKLQVKNNTPAAIPVDILSGVPSFRIRFNEEEVIAKMTIILEDLSTMIEDVPAGATVEKVLVGEVPEDFSEQISALSITTRFRETTAETTFIP